MKAQILDGKKVAEDILYEVKQRALNKSLKLAVVQVGKNSISQKYIQEKKKTAEEVGIRVELFSFPEDIQQEKLEREVERIGKDIENTGLLVQLPLPKHIDTQEVLDSIPADKDVDVLSSAAFERFKTGKFPMVPPVVGAVRALFSYYRIEVGGKRVTLVGFGRLVGMPLSVWLHKEGVTLLVADKKTKDVAARTREADIVISGVGKKNLITGDMVKEGVIVVDAGTSVEGGKTTGDVNFESVSEKASFITPVPGGVGPLTVACLLQNMVQLLE
jgi:methylenetetrahydrofolate dehydrogenase (NADP+) / methenyltetrahydrofolate cyclohydrolase